MAGSEEDFAAMLDASMQTGPSGGLERGRKVEGTIVQIGKDTIFVDVGTRSEARIDRHELTNEDGSLRVEVGDRIRATVLQGGDRPSLSVSVGRGSVDASSLELAVEEKTPVEGVVSRVVKGGLEVTVGSIRCFCPASQVDLNYVEDLSIYEGQSLRFLVTDVREKGRNVIVSRKALMRLEREASAKEIAANLEEGQVLEGKVTSIKDYGAFVDIGGMEGLVHISELGQGRVERVRDVVSIGEAVQVRILAVEHSGDDSVLPRLKLSMRTAAQSGGGRGSAKKILEVKIVEVEPHGIVVEGEEVRGMVPIRELDLAPGSDPRRSYPAGKTIEVVELGKDREGRPRFSVRRVEEARARENYLEFRKETRKKERKGAGEMGSFGELLKKKLS